MSEASDSDDFEIDIGENEYEVDQAALDDYLVGLRGEQNMAMGLLGGLIGAAIGAIGWAMITIATDTEFGLVAIAVGFLAGYGVRLLGKGMETKFGILGAALAFLGCFVGKLLTIAIFVSRLGDDAGFLQVLVGMIMTPGAVADLMIQTFNPMDLLFYGIALYEGYHFAFRKLDESIVTQFIRPKTSADAASESGQTT